jgi:anti-sigma factor RsiW
MTITIKHASFEARLTAYALGELSAEEHLEVGARVERSPELYREVEAIRETGELLEALFAAEDRSETGGTGGTGETRAAAPPRQRLLRVAVAAAAMALAASLLLVAWPRGEHHHHNHMVTGSALAQDGIVSVSDAGPER